MKESSQYRGILFLFKVLCMFFLVESALTPGYGGVLDLPVGARPVSLGGAYTAVIGTAEVIYFNPASLSTSPIFYASFFVTHLFQMKELQYAAAAVNVPCALGNMGLAFKSFGNSLYRENAVGLGWACSPVSNIHCGLVVKLQELRIKDYGSEGMWLLDLGVLFNISETVMMGGVVTNLRESSDSAYQQSVPLTCRSGLSWYIVPDFLLCLDLVWRENILPDYRWGGEFTLGKQCWVRLGMEESPPCLSSGIGLKWKAMGIDYAVRFHNYLGSTHYCSLSFALR